MAGHVSHGVLKNHIRIGKFHLFTQMKTYQKITVEILVVRNLLYGAILWTKTDDLNYVSLLILNSNPLNVIKMSKTVLFVPKSKKKPVKSASRVMF